MPRYEYRCRACGDTFEVSRPMAASADATPCPQGHDDTVKLLSTVSVRLAGASQRGTSEERTALNLSGTVTGAGRATTPAPRMAGGGGGCCGGACGCG